MVSSPITSWQIDGKSDGKRNSDRLYFLGLKITVDSNHNHAINKKTLAPWKKSYEKLDRVSNSQDISLPTKVYLVKAMFFQQPCMDVRARP